MATLIEVRAGRKIIGRCDEKCYLAKHPKCVCVCNGVNHGEGLSRAKANIERAGKKKIIEQFCKDKDRGKEELKILFDSEIDQLSLEL